MMDAFTFITLGFGAFNVATKAYEIYKKSSNKPKLIIDPERSINPTIIHLFVHDNTAPVTFGEESGYKIPYVVNRIGIKNIGKIAADDCHGYLVKDRTQERVSWTIPSDRAEITIYPNTREELELAAVFAPNLDELNIINDTSFTYMESLDLYDRLQLPHVISPTEHGFKSPPSLNRLISRGRYEVLITYKNPEAEPLRHPFDIMYV